MNLNWNIGGAKLLEEKTRNKREETRSIINKALLKFLTDRYPVLSSMTLIPL
jgi:hypothetical protein